MHSQFGLKVEIKVDGGVYRQRYERGKAVAPLEKWEHAERMIQELK